jgi:hypothetical protein
MAPLIWISTARVGASLPRGSIGGEAETASNSAHLGLSKDGQLCQRIRINSDHRCMETIRQNKKLKLPNS